MFQLRNTSSQIQCCARRFISMSRSDKCLLIDILQNQRSGVNTIVFVLFLIGPMYSVQKKVFNHIRLSIFCLSFCLSFVYLPSRSACFNCFSSNVAAVTILSNFNIAKFVCESDIDFPNQSHLYLLFHKYSPIINTYGYFLH